MPKQNDSVPKKYFEEKFNQVIEKLDWLIGKYNAHDEEHVLLNNKVSEHSDQLEVINNKLGIQT